VPSPEFALITEEKYQGKKHGKHRNPSTNFFAERERSFMNTLSKKVKPVSIFLAILLLLTSTLCRPASAGMVATEIVLLSERNHNRDTRDYCRYPISRETILNALVASGVAPSEARARVDSLSENEIATIADQIEQLAAGGNIAAGFIVVIVAVVLAVFIIVEYTSAVKMFPGH
jgi:hypothetical protein